MNKLFIKILIIGLVVFIIGLSLSVSRAYSSYQAKQIEKQGDVLLAENKYQEAIDKYLSSNKIIEREVLLRKITDTQDLLDSEENYQNGNEAIQNEKWDEAIIHLSKVNTSFKDYQRAQNLISYARMEKAKSEEEKEEVLGKQNASSNVPEVEVDQISNPQPTSTTVQTPEIQYKEIKIADDIIRCRADKYAEIIEAREKVYNTLDTSGDCMSDCSEEYLDCASKCNENTNSSYYQSCHRSCESIRSSCLSICRSRGISEAQMRGDILGNLIDLYCID